MTDPTTAPAMAPGESEESRATSVARDTQCVGMSVETRCPNLVELRIRFKRGLVDGPSHWVKMWQRERRKKKKNEKMGKQ